MIKKFVLFNSVFLLFFANANAQMGTIIIHRKSKLLEFFNDSCIILQFPIRVGKRSMETPLGEGYISIKREHPIFRYRDPGPDSGKIVQFADCTNGKIKVDYTKMRAIVLYYTKLIVSSKVFKRRHLKEVGEERFSIHSVTCNETIGTEISNGCIGLKIPDMLKLFQETRADPNGENTTKFQVIDD